MRKKLITSLATAAIAAAMTVAMPATAFAHDAAPGLKDATYTKAGTAEYFAVDVTDPDDATKTISAEDDWFKATWVVKLDGAEVQRNEAKTWTADVDGYTFDKDKGQVLLDSDLFTKRGKAQEYELVISATEPDHLDATAKLKVNYCSAQTLTLRHIDAEGNVVSQKTFTMDDLKNNEKAVTDQRFETVCGMSHGVMFIKADGVYLQDLLDQAGITFGPGQTLQWHTNDNAAALDTVDAHSDYFTIGYEDLMQPRYEFPGLLKDMATVTDLGATLPHLGMQFREKIVATSTGDYQMKEVKPFISYGYVEKDLAGVESAKTVNCIADGVYADRFPDEKSFRIFYGLALTEDGKMITDEVTTAECSYWTFCIDVIDGEAHHSEGNTSTDFDMMNDLRAMIDDAYTIFVDNGIEYPDSYDVTTDPKGLLQKIPFCSLEVADQFFTALSNTSSTDIYNNIEGVSSYGTTGKIRPPVYVLRNCKHFDYRISDSMAIMNYLKKAMDAANVTASDATLANGVAKPEIFLNGVKLVEGKDYTATYQNNTAPGTATATIVGDGDYAGTATVQFNVKAAPAPAKVAKAQTIKAKTLNKTFKAKKLKKKAQTFKIGASAKTKLSYKVTKKDNKKKLTFKNGTVTVKKGTKKGTYSMKVKITAKATSDFKSATKTVTIKVKVK